ncbi:MAG: hypothetical protein JSU05_13425 [Bacteroidetes bacterium]|nr:hypothetical protein [Bacteroidota bacterium]
MNIRNILSLILISAILFSCTKEVSFETGSNGSSGGSGGSGGTGGSGGGNTNGDLLIKALQITPATNDTDVITFGYDTNKRLTSYNATGKVNGTAIDIHYTITRLSDGKISKILSMSSTMLAAGVDSAVYYPFYVSGSSKLDYVLDTQYTSFGDLADSTIYTYNSSGQVVSKETIIDFAGITMPSAKEEYTYDGSGNVTLTKIYTTDGAGGFTQVSTKTNTFNSHKSGRTFGDESYIVLGTDNVSANDITGSAVNATTGTSYTSAMSQQTYNSFDRPISASATVTPQPPGYNLKLLYYYQ